MKIRNHEYDVELFCNRHGEYELLVRGRHDEIVARLYADPKDQPDTVEEGDFAVTVWLDDHVERYGHFTDYSLKRFEEVDRDAPEYSENTLYWSFSSEYFDWYRQPLHSWETCLISGDGLVVFEVEYGRENLNNIFDRLATEYMERAADEFTDGADDDVTLTL